MRFRGFLLFALLAVHGFASQKPEQVHISLTGDLTEMFVTWLTMDKVNSPAYVKYGLSNDAIGSTVSAETENFTDPGETGIIRYVYRAKLIQLQPDTTYYYQVGTDGATSKIFSFKTFPQGDFPLRICIFGDLGIVNGQFDALVNGAAKGLFDMVIHIGDFAYDLHTNDGSYGDQFFQLIEPIASKMPYMAVVGNHETAYNYLHYKMRFRMPDNGAKRNEGFFYSFDAGLVHFTGLSSEFYDGEGWLDYAQDQFTWLENDLKSTTQPWKITYLHRPMYCSNNKPSWNDGDCNDVTATRIRQGGDGYPGLEDAFMNNKVDFAFYGHMHSYERMWPVYNKTVYRDGQTNELYLNPTTPVHVITGSAGCHTPHTPQDENEAWSCARNEDFGFTVLQIYNKTHIHLRQYSTEQQKDVDQMWLIKTDTTVSTTPTTTITPTTTTKQPIPPAATTTQPNKKPSTTAGKSTSPSTTSAATPSTTSVATPSTTSAATPSTTSVATPSTTSAATPSTTSVATPSTTSAATPSTTSVATPSTTSDATPSTTSAANLSSTTHQDHTTFAVSTTEPTLTTKSHKAAAKYNAIFVPLGLAVALTTVFN